MALVWPNISTISLTTILVSFFLCSMGVLLWSNEPSAWGSRLVCFYAIIIGIVSFFLGVLCALYHRISVEQDPEYEPLTNRIKKPSNVSLPNTTLPNP